MEDDGRWAQARGEEKDRGEVIAFRAVLSWSLHLLASFTHLFFPVVCSDCKGFRARLTRKGFPASCTHTLRFERRLRRQRRRSPSTESARSSSRSCTAYKCTCAESTSIRRSSSSTSCSDDSSSRSSSSSSSSDSPRRSKKDRKRRHKNDKKSKKSKDKKKSKGKSRSKDKQRDKSAKEQKWNDDSRVVNDPSRRENHSRQPHRLHFLPRSAANVIQKVFRGHAVRKWTTRKIREIRAFRRELTRHIMNEVLHDVLEKEFVPDILVEIVTAMPPDIFAPHPAWLRDQLAAAEKITTETVTKLIREVVRETFNDLVNEYLMKERMEQKKKGTKTDQLAHYVELEIVQPVLKPILLTLAREECAKTWRWRSTQTWQSLRERRENWFEQERIRTGGEKAVVQQYTERTMDRLLYRWRGGDD
eukprot:750882-Hanusia_phi.AAC.2